MASKHGRTLTILCRQVHIHCMWSLQTGLSPDEGDGYIMVGEIMQCRVGRKNVGIQASYTH